MAMKRTQLEKLRAVAILDRIRHNLSPGRFGQQSSQFMNRKERREAEKAAGLVPFAVKLQGRLVERLRQLAHQRAGDINGVVAELLETGLAKFPETVVEKTEVAQPANPVPASAAPLTLAQKLVAVALGTPGATAVEKPVVKPVKVPKPVKPPKAPKPVVVKPVKKTPAAKPAKAAKSTKASPQPKKTATQASKKAPAGGKKAASAKNRPAPAKKAVGVKKSVAASKPALRKPAKAAKKATSKPVSKVAGKARRKA